jgi:membrane protein DedA with SNARE-associated domain
LVVSISRTLLLVAVAAAVIPGSDGLLEFVASVEDRWSTYLALAASTPFVSELAPIMAGLAVHEDRLPIARVIVAVTVGGWLATALLYVSGRLKWEWLRRRSRTVRSTGTVVLRIVRRNPWRASFLVRFLFGARILLPMACGAARVPLAVYLPMSLLGSLAWSSVFVFVGMAAGQAAEQVLGRIRDIESVMYGVGGVLLVVAVNWWWRRRRRRAERRLRQRGAINAPPTGD